MSDFHLKATQKLAMSKVFFTVATDHSCGRWLADNTVLAVYVNILFLSMFARADYQQRTYITAPTPSQLL